jgi:hypothetical protein
MSILMEKDPRIASIVDRNSQRNLLDDPHPVEVDTKSGTGRFVLLVNNGYEAPAEVTIRSDQAWLQPQSTQLSLMGGAQAECVVQATASGEGEFGNLCFSWEGASETYSEYVLVWRKAATPPPPPPPTKPTPQAGQKKKPGSDLKAPGVAPLPDWMR